MKSDKVNFKDQLSISTLILKKKPYPAKPKLTMAEAIAAAVGSGALVKPNWKQNSP